MEQRGEADSRVLVMMDESDGGEAKTRWIEREGGINGVGEDESSIFGESAELKTTANRKISTLQNKHDS